MNFHNGALATFHNVEAEQQVLGAIMHDNRALDLVGDILRPEYFGDPVHRRIYEVSAARIEKRDA